jgi:hypothetical protein
MALTKVSSGVLNIDDLYGFRNRIINGDMRIAQRGTAAVTTNGAFPVDRFLVSNSTDGAYSGQQDTSAPTGFINSVKYTVTTEDSSIGATQWTAFRQKIEGTNVSDLAWGTASAKTVTLSFWVRSSLTGTFGGGITNSGQSRCYPFTYTISVADTWEYKTVTIAGDTTGTWLTTTGSGIELFWDLGVGSTYRGPPGSWSGTLYLGATGATDVISTLNATWYITGVQLEVGSVATPFERRPYGTELALCQRYYFRVNASGTGVYFGSGYNRSTTDQESIIAFPVSMRIVPTSLTTSGTAADYRVNHGTTATNCSSVPVLQSRDTATNGVPLFVVASGLTAGQGSASAASNSSAFLAWSAEL